MPTRQRMADSRNYGSPRTPTERYLGSLARDCFLSMWAYPNVFRDQGGAKPGKEVCDLLVVFENDILIFSDKDVHYPDTGSPDLDWQRWYRRAVRKSAEQVWGAERWLRGHPDRLFLDAACKVPFPLELPDPPAARYHRIVVAHDSTGRRRDLIGGSGSLIIAPEIVGEAHVSPEEEGGRPFGVGWVDQARGFVHVLDEVSLEMVLRTLDTIRDFVAYLVRKEVFIRSGRLAVAMGEEELLGFYLRDLNEHGVHDFVVPSDVDQVLIEEGHFAHYATSPEAAAKAEADRVSVLWDRIIEEFSEHARDGTLYQASDSTFATQERILRILARETRVRRRMLSRSLLDKIRQTGPRGLGVRSVEPSEKGDPWYVFVCIPRQWSPNEKEYRERRVAFLTSYCKVVKLERPEIATIIGIATESETGQGRSHDLVLLDGRLWTKEDYEEARLIKRETGFMNHMRQVASTEKEYPVGVQSQSRKVGRNKGCPCGSGKKYKRCHGKPGR